MTEQRKAEILAALRGIAAAFEPTEETPSLTMFDLVVAFNEADPNPELIGGAWVREHAPDLADLP